MEKYISRYLREKLIKILDLSLFINNINLI